MQPRKVISKPKKIKDKKISIKNGISYLNLIALGANTDNLAQSLTSLIAYHNCNIINSRIMGLGEDLSFSALINGKWNEIIKLEKSLVSLTKKYSLHIFTKRNNNAVIDNVPEANLCIDYVVQATTINRIGLLNKLLQFFHKENIGIKEANVKPVNSNTHLINIEIHVQIPADRHIVTLREAFLIYCDTLNLDTSLEPAN